VKTPVDAPNRAYAVGRDGQFRSDIDIRRRPALERKQTRDHLQAVQQPMIGFLAQDLVLLDQFVFLTKQIIFSGESRSQPDFYAPVLCQLPFVACDGAALGDFERCNER
jgi:hypothetical protein